MFHDQEIGRAGIHPWFERPGEILIGWSGARTRARKVAICRSWERRNGRNLPREDSAKAPVYKATFFPFVFIAVWSISASAFADTLASGSVYFDSQKTLEEVVRLSAQKDNASILKLIQSGQVSQQIGLGKDIVVLTTGLTPDSPAEFRFVSGSVTYWTLTKFINKGQSVETALTPERSPTAETGAAEASPTVSERRRRESRDNDPTDNDNGRRIWHKVNGRWKWYPASRKAVKKALPETPRAVPAKPSPAPQTQ